jgi:hypothetical protein
MEPPNLPILASDSGALAIAGEDALPAVKTETASPGAFSHTLWPCDKQPRHPGEA